MKPLRFENFSEWEFFVTEVSANVYKVLALHGSGASIEKQGEDVEMLIAEIQRDISKNWREVLNSLD